VAGIESSGTKIVANGFGTQRDCSHDWPRCNVALLPAAALRFQHWVIIILCCDAWFTRGVPQLWWS
jgi:hypothetical protein